MSDLLIMTIDACGELSQSYTNTKYKIGKMIYGSTMSIHVKSLLLDFILAINWWCN